MRNGKLEIGEFGPLGYVLAHQVAKAEAVARVQQQRRQARQLLGEPRDLSDHRASKPSPIFAAIRSPSPTRLRPPATCSRPMACARPASIPTRTSRRSMPAAIPRRSRRSTITRSMPANSTASSSKSATQRGHYKDGDLVFLWKSDPIPTDPIAVRGDLPDGLQAEADRRAAAHRPDRASIRPIARSWACAGIALRAADRSRL